MVVRVPLMIRGRSSGGMRKEIKELLSIITILKCYCVIKLFKCGEVYRKHKTCIKVLFQCSNINKDDPLSYNCVKLEKY